MITVSSDGNGTFKTISEALDYIIHSKISERVIYIKSGIYKEKIRVLTDGISLTGADPETTIITFDDNARKILPDGRLMGTFNSYTINVAADDVTLENLSIINSAGYGDLVGQSVALCADADRFICHNCKIISHQDTLYTGPMPSNPSPSGVNPIHPYAGFGQWKVKQPFRQYYNSCTIQGDVDFIFGSATAMFDKCTIVSNKRSSERYGYITAASTFPDEPFGFVFSHCNLIGDAEKGSVYLGRPWRITAKTVFLKCTLGDHINKCGWHDWDKPESHQTICYGEYCNTGTGAVTDNRPSWVKILDDCEANDYTVENILSGNDHWDPVGKIG